MDQPIMIIDASDGNVPQLAVQLSAMAVDGHVSAQLICPDALREPATRMMSDLGLQNRLNFVTESEMLERIAG